MIMLFSHQFFLMGSTLGKLKVLDTFKEEKGEKKKKKECGTNLPDPSVDEYILFYHTTCQLGVPDHVYKFEKSL